MKKYFKQLKANKKGFTLIEMIVVIAIIGILAAILVPSMAGYLSTAKESRKEANAKMVYTAAQAAVTSLEATQSIGDHTYEKPNNNDTIDTTDTTGKLFKKIKELIGAGNYDKFDVIQVIVKDGAVTKVLIKEIATDNGDGVSYPKTPTSSTPIPTS